MEETSKTNDKKNKPKYTIQIMSRCLWCTWTLSIFHFYFVDIAVYVQGYWSFYSVIRFISRNFVYIFRSILFDKQLSLLYSWKCRNEFAKKNTQSNGLCVHFALLIRNKAAAAAVTAQMNEHTNEIYLVEQR